MGFNKGESKLSDQVNYWIEALQTMVSAFDAPKLDNLNYHTTNLCELQNQIIDTYDT
jgi:hypothetical protein